LHQTLRLALVGAACLAARASAVPLRAQEREIFVNTTSFLGSLASHCLPGQPCTIESALEKTQTFGGVVTACFEGGCPPGITPLGTDDPNYDPATGKWSIRYGPKWVGLLIDRTGVKVDFTRHVEGWSGPADNRLVIDTDVGLTFNHILTIEGHDNVLMGFDLRGRFDDAAIIVRKGATGNQIGPGLVFAGIKRGPGLRILDGGTTRNRVVGNWCGIVGPDAQPDVLDEDCVQLDTGANGNTIGGPEPADRNVLSGAKFGVALRNPATRDNVIQGNYIGLDPTGAIARPNESGVAILEQASGTLVTGNVLSGNNNAGIFAVDASTEFGRTRTPIQGNIIGADATGKKPVPNGDYGVRIEGLAKDVQVVGNRIRYNGAGGVLICGALTRNNTVSENEISGNHGSAISVCAAANEGVAPPVLTRVSTTDAAGAACAGCRVELFSDPLEEALSFEGAVTADATGAFSLSKPEGFAYRNLTATATDDKNTSGLSAARGATRPTLTPTLRPGEATATPGGRTPTPTRPPATGTPQSRVFLPWLARAFERAAAWGLLTPRAGSTYNDG